MSRVSRQRDASDERRARLTRGRVGEFAALLLLLAKGYRPLARRQRTPYGEVDLIVVRGHRLAFVEVKRRRTRDDAEAALTPSQAGRIGRAADWWIARNPRYQDHDIGLDAVLVTPWRMPSHLPNALDAA